MLGLCLSGGGIKAAAHVGVIKAFEEAKVHIDAISGASAGSIVAVLYACGYSADEIYKIFQKYSKKIKYAHWKNIFKLICSLFIKGELGITGLNSGKEIEDVIKKSCEEKKVKNINQIRMPIFIPAVDIKDGTLYVFTSKIMSSNRSETKYVANADIAKIVRASCSYPGLYEPCKLLGLELVDGGIRENTPWQDLKKYNKDNRVVGVVFNEEENRKCCKDIINVITNSVNIVIDRLADCSEEGIDEKIEINTNKVGLLEMKKMQLMYEKGYKAGKEYVRKMV